MTPLAVVILALGVFVVALAFAGAFLIGLTEAADVDHARPEDLSALEQSLVDREEQNPP